MAEHLLSEVDRLKVADEGEEADLVVDNGDGLRMSARTKEMDRPGLSGAETYSLLPVQPFIGVGSGEHGPGHKHGSEQGSKAEFHDCGFWSRSGSFRFS